MKNEGLGWGVELVCQFDGERLDRFKFDSLRGRLGGGPNWGAVF